MLDVPVIGVKNNQGLSWADAQLIDAAFRVRPGPRVTIDLSHLDILSPDAALYLVAILTANPVWRVRAPAAFDALKTLRDWDIDVGLEAATGRPFSSFLTDDSVDHWQRVLATVPPPGLPVEMPPDDDAPPHSPSELTRTLPRTHFAITALKLPESPRTLASSEKNRWREGYIKGVLENALGLYAPRVGTHVVYEAVMNASTHPAAAVALTSSSLRLPRRGSRKSGYLQVGIWDNGLTVAETLGESLKRYGTIYSPAFDPDQDKISTLYRRDGHTERFEVPGADESTNECRLVSAFLQGVTSIPDGEVERDEDDAAPTKYRGYGLQIIRNTVVNDFSGTVHYLSGKDRLVLHRLDAGRRSYIANFDSFERQPVLAGNLLAVYIPIPALADNG